MKNFFVAVMLLIAAYAVEAQTTYYVSAAGNGTNDGLTTSTTWSLAKLNTQFSSLSAGDTVRFKKGDTFTGTLTISRSGSAGSSIYISSYGSGNKPVLLYDVAGNSGTSVPNRYIIDGSTGKSYITIDGLNFTDTTVTASTIHTLTTAHTGYAISFRSAASHIKITNCDISQVGIGIEINGTVDSITNNTFTDFGMVVNDGSANNDYGANGIVFGGSNNVITGNTFTNLWAPSTDYKYDGGAIELFAAVSGQSNTNSILRNKATNCEGFMEFGSNNSNDVVSGNTIAYNRLINNGRVFYINNSGQFATGVTNIYFYNNDVVETVAQRSNYVYLFTSATTAPSSCLISKNNIFYIRRYVTVAKSTFGSSAYTHTNNIYDRSSGTLGFTLSGSESDIGTSSALFNSSFVSDPSLWDYSLDKTSTAVDFGTDVSLTSDIEGNNVPTGGAPDAGAYETTDTATLTFYKDEDKDGFGNVDSSVAATAPPLGYVSDSTDCDDTDATIYPNAPELCDSKDNNCNGSTDENCDTVSITFASASFYAYERDKKIYITLNFSKTLTENISLTYTTIDGTAIAGSDYVPKTGTLTLSKGTSSAKYSISIIRDRTTESTEYFKVRIYSADAVIPVDEATCYIYNSH